MRMLSFIKKEWLKDRFEADTLDPYYELLYLPFEKNVDIPKFKDSVKTNKNTDSGFTLYYSNQCPFTSKYVSMEKNFTQERDVQLSIIKYENKEQAQNSNTPFTTYSLYYNGEFITHEILNDKKFEDIFISKKFIKDNKFS